MSSDGKSPYTCMACCVVFQDANIHKEHYKTDWHRYNLHRRVANLPSIKAEDFRQRVIDHKIKVELSNQDQSVYCKACKKSFANQKSYDNHLNSKKHKENEVNYVDEPAKQSEDVDSDVESVDSDEWDKETENPIDNNTCLFCSHQARNFLSNLEHMTTEHSFFITDVEYCSDVEGLMRYLGEKVTRDFMCLWCNEKGRTFHTAEAAKSHMVDKGHCRMLYEGLALAEYTDFYDYSSSYPDTSEHKNADEEVDVPVLDSSEYQLVLPSGATVGHRSLMRYYQQSTVRTAVVPSKNNRKLHKVLAAYKSIGWSTSQQEVAKHARDVHYMKRLQSRLYMKLGVKGNSCLQSHFRQQVLF